MTLKIGPGNFFGAKNPKIIVRKAGEMILGHYLDQVGVVAGFFGTSLRMNFRSPEKNNSWGLS